MPIYQRLPGVILSFFILTVIVSSCKEETGLQISGVIEDNPSMGVYLDQMGIQSTMVKEKVESDKSGQFRFEYPEKLPSGLYRIRAGARSAHFVVNNDSKHIIIKGKLSGLAEDDYIVEGSPLTEKYVQYMSKVRNNELQPTELGDALASEDPLLAMLVALRTLSGRPEYADIHTNIAARVTETFPEYETGKEYAAMAEAMALQYKQMMATSRISVGELAPDISMENPDGKIMKLSDLKGKVVLLDFWASWCGPCRRENPKVVNTYKKFKDKGFTVFSVSLDGVNDRSKQNMDETRYTQSLLRSKDKWVAAIEQDKLEWDSHVSDLKQWSSAAAAEYGVTSIPKTFLIDREGKIAAINPRYNLEEQLQKLL